MSEKQFKSGFVAIIGAPNVGKSTLLNRILGQKISIISEKPQTTRNRILGVLNRPNSQIIFLDTPGIHSSKKPLNMRMVQTALTAAEDVDVILFIVDVSKPDDASESLIVYKLKNQNKKVVLALNKIDKLDQKSQILPIIEQWNALNLFQHIIPISALEGTQLDELCDALESQMEQGPQFFNEDSVTDMPERFIAAEMIREKIFRFTSNEIPYATAVTIESFQEDTDKPLVRIHATIHVERDSQKGIIIGKGGHLLKKIGQAARQDIENMIGTQVFLKLFVRVKENWAKDTKALQRFGY